MRRALVFLFIILTPVAFAQNVAADSLFLEDVTSNSVTLSSTYTHDFAVFVLVYVDDGHGWRLRAFHYYWQTEEYKVIDLEPEKTYRFKLRFCWNRHCSDSSETNVVEATTKETPSDPLPVILAVVSVIVGIAVIALIALRKRRLRGIE